MQYWAKGVAQGGELLRPSAWLSAALRESPVSQECGTAWAWRLRRRLGSPSLHWHTTEPGSGVQVRRQRCQHAAEWSGGLQGTRTTRESQKRYPQAERACPATEAGARSSIQQVKSSQRARRAAFQWWGSPQAGASGDWKRNHEDDDCLGIVFIFPPQFHLFCEPIFLTDQEVEKRVLIKSKIECILSDFITFSIIINEETGTIPFWHTKGKRPSS